MRSTIDTCVYGTRLAQTAQLFSASMALVGLLGIAMTIQKHDAPRDYTPGAVGAVLFASGCASGAALQRLDDLYGGNYEP